MNYYPFHVGDYAAHTAHLEPMEDLAYRRMLDHYYLHEAPLPAEPAEVARLVRMRGNVAEVTVVLQEFFTLTEAGWVSVRCEEELAKMQDKQAKAKAAAGASVAARQAKAAKGGSTPAQRPLNERSTNAQQTDSAGSTGVELPTPTPTPTPDIPPDGGKARKRAAAPATPPPGLEDVPERMLADYMAVRKEKRAGPLTDTAVKGLLREAARAGITAAEAVQACCEFGWQGFNAGWYAERKSQRSTTAAGAAPAETVYQRSMRERMEQAVPSIARRAPAPSQDAADFFRTVEVPARVVPDSKAIEVTS